MTTKSKHTVAEFWKLKEQFLTEVVAAVEMEEIPPELILNWTGNIDSPKQHLDYGTARHQVY